MASCPASTPRLKPTRASTSASRGRPRSARTLANPNPWIRPNPKATAQRRPATTGQRLFSAASTTDSAMVDSTNRDGRAMTESAARLRVIEWASVNAVTIRSTSQNTGAKRSAGSQPRLPRKNTAGSSRQTRNRMWSNPIRMCQMPSRP